MANELEKTNNEPNQVEINQTDNDTALKNLEARIKELETDNSRLKQSITNASADASRWKKQYQEKLSDTEKAEQERSEQTAAMQKELEMLRTEKNIATFTSALVAADIGMDSETAKSVAEALNANEPDKVFDGIRKFIKSHDKALHENALKNNPTLSGGSVAKAVSKADFEKMGYREMVQFKTDHPELYEEYTKKK